MSANDSACGNVCSPMRALLVLVLLGALALMAYNYSAGRDLFQWPSESAAVVEERVRDKVGTAVRDTVESAARRTGDEVKERAAAGVQTAVDRAQEAVTAAALTSKIKAKMALDDLVKASEIDVDTTGSVVTLTGDVATADERRRAGRIATETAGVSEVVNKLRVR